MSHFADFNHEGFLRHPKLRNNVIMDGVKQGHMPAVDAVLEAQERKRERRHGRSVDQEEG